MENDPAPVDRSKTWTVSQPTVRSTGLAIATVLGGVLCAFVAYPLLAPLLWATVLGVVARPWHRWVECRVRNPSIAAALVVGAVALLVAVPFAFVVVQLFQELADAAARLQSGEASRALQGVLERQPRLATLIEWMGRRIDLKTVVGQWSGGAAS